MPGSARRVRAAYSRTLCLPCLKAGIFCFYTTATTAYMSSFLFLTFCVYVFCCLGLHFSAVPLSNPFFRWLLPVPYKPPQEPYTPPTGPVLCSASVVSLPCPQNRTQGRTGASSFFLPRTGLPLPLKGEGRGTVCLWFVGFALLVQNRATVAQQGRSRASLVSSFPYPAPKIAYRPTQGRVWFWLAGWHFIEGPLLEIPCKKSSRRKNTPAPLLKNRPG